MRRLFIPLAIVLTACSGGEPRSKSTDLAAAKIQSIQLTADQRKHVEAGVRRSLKDPNSAMFGEMRAIIDPETPNSYVICGYVNSKNSYGGYVGDKPFLAMYALEAKAAVLIGVGGTSAATYAVTTQCRNYGLSI